MTFDINIKAKDRIPVIWNNKKNTGNNKISVTGKNKKNTNHKGTIEEMLIIRNNARNTSYREQCKYTNNK